jgi:hypothetical protein
MKLFNVEFIAWDGSNVLTAVKANTLEEAKKIVRETKGRIVEIEEVR